MSSAPGSIPRPVAKASRAARYAASASPTAAAIEGQHLLCSKALAVRLLADERVELGDDDGVPSEREIGVDPLLERRKVSLLELCRRALRKRLVIELGQRNVAPESERLVEQRGPSDRVGRRPSLGSETVEAAEVERTRLDLEHVPGCPSGQRRVSVPERLAQPGDVDL